MSRLKFITEEQPTRKGVVKQSIPYAEEKKIYTKEEYNLLLLLTIICRDYAELRSVKTSFGSACIARLIKEGYTIYSEGFLNKYEKKEIKSKLDFISIDTSDRFTYISKIDVKTVAKLIDGILRTHSYYMSPKKNGVQFGDEAPEIVLAILEDLGIIKL